jgi:hypothetical protein
MRIYPRRAGWPPFNVGTLAHNLKDFRPNLASITRDTVQLWAD